MLRIVGLNHHSASLDVRERLAFSAKQAAQTLSVWQDTTADLEAVLLSTCNRTEFYVASETATLPPAEKLVGFLLEQKNSSEIFVPASQVFILDNLDAAQHLFSVAAGLDSMVLGDMQILSQVKNAYQQALEAETAGTVLHTLFQSALKTAKRVASETELHRYRTSVPSIAVNDFAMRIFEKLNDKQIFVFGAGEMAEETLRYLADNGGKNVTVLNRHRERAENLSAQFNGNVLDWDKRFDALVQGDILVSATGASEPIITLQDYLPLEKQRNGKTLFILDLAVPRNIEPALGKCEGVYLYSIDDLQASCEQNRLERNKSIPKAEQIVRQSARELVRDITHRKSGKIIRQLRERWTKIKDAELERLFHKLPELNEKERSEIEYAFERLTAKFLHPPMESLRHESIDGEPNSLLEALAKLFKLGK
ncbi:glutamyl-tRNA reductase [Planctomycetales bacterium]|nr:glutamyl-tRNA reductase [Planctomycetales bacterium]